MVRRGGRVAEELIFGHEQVTTGASSDLQQATSMARNMVTKYGMSDAVGPLYIGGSELENLSPTAREAVEAEIKAMVKAGDANARRIITEHKAELHRLAQGLLAHETISREDIGELIAGRELKRENKENKKDFRESVKKGGAALGKGGTALPATARAEQAP
jgi:ATP-dependent Zn protease